MGKIQNAAEALLGIRGRQQELSRVHRDSHVVFGAENACHPESVWERKWHAQG